MRDDLYLLLDPVNGNLSLIIVLHDIDKARREYSLLILAAERDSMTGLLNHESTAGRIERYLDGAEGMQALFMIDLDNFKDVNDNFGHQYGDRMLTDVADAVKGTFRDSDIVGRMAVSYTHLRQGRLLSLVLPLCQIGGRQDQLFSPRLD